MKRIYIFYILQHRINFKQSTICILFTNTPRKEINFSSPFPFQRSRRPNFLKFSSSPASHRIIYEMKIYDRHLAEIIVVTTTTLRTLRFDIFILLFYFDKGSWKYEKAKFSFTVESQSRRSFFSPTFEPFI